MSKPLLLALVVVACSSSPPSQDGRRVFAAKQCDACHSVDGRLQIGPSLQAAFGKRVQLDTGDEVAFDEPYFIESVLDPDARIVQGYPGGVHPSYRGHVDDAELEALLAYVKTL